MNIFQACCRDYGKVWSYAEVMNELSTIECG